MLDATTDLRSSCSIVTLSSLVLSRGTDVCLISCGSTFCVNGKAKGTELSSKIVHLAPILQRAMSTVNAQYTVNKQPLPYNWQPLNLLYTKLQQSLRPLIRGQRLDFTTTRQSSFTSQKLAYKGLPVLPHTFIAVFRCVQAVVYCYILEPRVLRKRSKYKYHQV